MNDYYDLTDGDINFINDDFFMTDKDLDLTFDEIADNLRDKYDDHPDIQYQDQTSIIPGHLGAPINLSDAEFVLKFGKDLCPRHRMLMKIRDAEKITKTIDRITKFGRKVNSFDYYNEWLKDNFKRSQYDDRLLFDKFVDISVESLYIHIKTHLKNICSYETLYQALDKEKDELKMSLKMKWNLLANDFMNMKKVEVIKDRICYEKIKHGEFKELPHIRLDRDITINDVPGFEKNLGSTNLFLCFLDKTQSLFSLKFYWILSDLTNKYSESIFEQGLEIYEKMKDLRSSMGENFFKFVSLWEPLVVGYVVMDDVDDLGFTKLYEDTRSEMEKILKEESTRFDIDCLLPKERNDNLITLFIELTGMSKIFGHPTLDPGVSLDPLREWGKEENTNFNETIAKKSLGVAKRDFIIQYKEKHGKLPNMKTIPKDIDNYFRYREGKDNRMTTFLNHELWGSIEFEKTLDYDFTIDSTELIRDSAAAPKLSEWTCMYDRCAFYHYYGKVPPKKKRSTPTRIMTSYLEGSPEDLVKKIAQLNLLCWDKEDSIAVICQKEGELKVLTGRGFVKQTHIQRLVQTSMEHNMAKFLRYVPEQTMTDSEIIEMRKISSDVKGLGKNWELINLDLHKWNLKFRHVLVTGFGRMLDQLYGINNFYEFNHIWFLRCFVFTNSRLHPPDFDENGEPVEGQFGYRGHLGGFEGMRQKLWTWITMSIMKYTADIKDLRIRIMGQGDNQVIIVKYKPDQLPSRKRLQTEFLDLLESNFADVNLKLKKEETWISQRLHEYGKNRHYNGIAISQGTKKCVKFIPDINDNIKSLMSSLSTINTITESIAKMDTNPDRAFILNQFHILNLLQRNNIIQESDSNLNCMALLYHPTDFGGICLSTYFSHFVRGYDDKVNLWIYIFKNIHELGKTDRFFSDLILKICSMNQFFPRIKGRVTDKQLLRLFEDSFSLNIINLPSVEMKFKNISSLFLRNPKFVKNESVSKLFEVDQSQQQMFLVEKLKEMKPVYLTLIFEYFRNSNYGIAKTLQNKFTNIQTISKIVQQTMSLDFLEMTQENNRVTIEILKRRKVNNSYNRTILRMFEDYECSTELTKQLRKENWDLDLLNDTKPLPLCQFTLCDIDKITAERYQGLVGITAKLSSEFAESSEAYRFHPGPWDGYLGNKTAQKINKPKMELQTKSAYLKSVQNLYLIYTWLTRINSPNLAKFTLDLIKEKQQIIPEMLEINDFSEWCPTNYGGNMIHRFQSIIESTSAIINMLPTMTNHVRYDTNKLQLLTEGGSDFTIHFQLCLIVFSTIFNRMKRLGLSDGASSFIFVLRGCKCTENVTSLEFDIPEYSCNSTPTPENDIIKEIQTFRVDTVKITEQMMGALLSFYLGSLLGKTIEKAYHDTYLNKDLIAKETFNKPNLLSVNDLRFVSFPYLILGILYSCNYLISNIYIKEDIVPLLSSNISATILCQVLFDAGILNKFFEFLDVEITTHYEGLAFDRMSHVILNGIIHNVRDHIDEYLKLLLKINFKDIEISKMRHLLFCLILNNIHRKESDRSTKIRFYKKDYNIIRKKINESSDWIVINRYIRQIMSLRRVVEHVDCKLETILTIWRTRTIEYRNHVKNLNIESESALSTRDKLKLTRIMNTYKIIKEPMTNIQSCFFRDHYEKSTSRVRKESDVEKPFHIKNVHHLSRVCGKISSAVTKLFEMVLLFSLDKLKITSIVSLAEGSGGCICSLGEIFKEATLTYNTLLSTDIDIRENIDQNYPPAYFNSSDHVKKRIDSGDKDLILGETNILNERFKEKFSIYCRSRMIDILTMDAESVQEGNNLEFLRAYLPLFVEHRIRLGIFKIFLLNPKTLLRLANIIEEYLENQNDKYSVCIFKPLSSNQNNKEVYLLILNNNRKTCYDEFYHNQVLDKIREHKQISESQMISWVINSHFVNNLETAIVYFESSLTLKNVIMNNIRNKKFNIILFDKYSKFLIENNCCTLFCKRMIQALIKLFLDIHTMNINNDALLPIIRTSNVNDVLYQLLKNILFSLMVHDSEGDHSQVLNFLSTVNINPDLTNYRSSSLNYDCINFMIDDEETNFSDAWSDSKLYFKHYQGLVECNCRLTEIKDRYEQKSLNQFMFTLSSFTLKERTKDMTAYIFGRFKQDHITYD